MRPRDGRFRDACTLAMLLCCLTVASARGVKSGATTDYNFCVIGAGPGGLQAAFYLQQLGVPYAVFERAPRAGDFFRQYPRHRSLISINKVHTGNADPEFNLRHDWNSLLYDELGSFDAGRAHFSEPQSNGSHALPSPRSTRRPLLFKDFTKKYYPHADHLVEYLNTFVDRHDLHIFFDHDVLRVAKASRRGGVPAPAASVDGHHQFVVERAGQYFVLYVRRPASGSMHAHTHRVTCDVLLLGTGKFVPNKGSVGKGEELLEGYESVSTTARDFRNQEVLVIGSGNSALELLRNIEDETAFVHVVSRTPIKIAFQTHYPGHVRGVNLAIAEKYMLKSLDALISDFALTSSISLTRDNSTGRIHIHDASRENQQHGDKMGTPGREGMNEMLLPDPFERGYHRIIRCLGFRYDSSIFPAPDAASTTGVEEAEEPVVPVTGHTGAYPVVASNFESTNVPNLFVVGSLMHFHDHKKSAGGFIHGFRYLARTLVHQLRETFLGVPYPAVVLPPPPSASSSAAASGRSSRDTLVDALISHIADRLPRVSSLYQMQSALADVIFLTADGSKGVQLTAAYLRDVPLSQARSAFPNSTNLAAMRTADCFITLSLEFGEYFQGVGVLHHQGQEETESRKREKVMWSRQWGDEHPDLEHGFHRAQPHTTRGRAAAELAQKRNGARGEASAGRTSEMLMEVLKPLEPLPFFGVRPATGEMSHTGGKSKFGFQFIHPVFRFFVRQLGQVTREAVEVAEHRLMENVHNNWVDPTVHLQPLRRFLKKVIPEMQLLEREGGASPGKIKKLAKRKFS